MAPQLVVLTYSWQVYDFLIQAHLLSSIKALSSKRIFPYPNVTLTFEEVLHQFWAYLQQHSKEMRQRNDVENDRDDVKRENNMQCIS